MQINRVQKQTENSFGLKKKVVILLQITQNMFLALVASGHGDSFGFMWLGQRSTTDAIQ